MATVLNDPEVAPLAGPAETLPVVGANGDLYVAPAGTPIPTSWTTLDTDPWRRLGLVSEDGLAFAPETEVEGIKAWQTLYDVRRLKTSIEATLTFALMEWNAENVVFAFGGGSWTAGVAPAFNVYTPPTPDEQAVFAIAAKVLDGPLKLGLYFPQAIVDELDEVSFKRDEAALLAATVGILGSSTVAPWNAFSDDPRFVETP